MNYPKPSLQRLRKQKGITLAILAKQTGIAETTINNYELGRYNMGQEYLEKIAKALEVSPEEVLKPEATVNVLVRSEPSGASLHETPAPYGVPREFLAEVQVLRAHAKVLLERIENMQDRLTAQLISPEASLGRAESFGSKPVSSGVEEDLANALREKVEPARKVKK